MKSNLTSSELSDMIQRSKVAHLNRHLVKGTEKEKKKRAKYGNDPTFVDDIKFASIKEADRYKVLKLLAKHAEIGLLKTQVEFELNPGGAYSYKYIADFTYYQMDIGDFIVEDTKGFRTKEYLRKRRLMKKIYGIEIKET